jgi:HAMP domain-containing protein
MTLRKKLGAPPVVHTVVGAGYRLAEMSLTERAPPCVAADAGLRRGGRDVGCCCSCSRWCWSSGRCRGDPGLPRASGSRCPTGASLTFGASRPLAADALDRRCCDRACSRCCCSARPGVAVLLLAGRVLQPLQDITAAAQRLSAERLDARIALAARGRAQAAADTFDDMLGRWRRPSRRSAASSPTPATSCARRWP